jgi:hypothetical protein
LLTLPSFTSQPLWPSFPSVCAVVTPYTYMSSSSSPAAADAGELLNPALFNQFVCQNNPPYAKFTSS